MLTFIKRILGLAPTEDRRQYERYPVSAPLRVKVDGADVDCLLDNVSAGGLRLEPRIAAAVGEMIVIEHPPSGLHLEGTVVGNDEQGTRVSFTSAEAGAVVSVWLRLLHEEELAKPATA